MQKINCAHNANPLIALEPQEMKVAGNNQISVAGDGTGKNMVVVGVFLDSVGDGFGNNEFPNTGDKFKAITNLVISP